MSSMEEIFGEVISVYTREQAHEDGVLIDVNDTDAGRLFKFPVSITVALYSALRVGAGKEDASFAARLFDVCYMAVVASKRAESSDVFFKVKVGRRVLALRGNCGPGDDAAPVMTFGFPEDF